MATELTPLYNGAYSPEAIIARVKRHDEVTMALRRRMDEDYDLYRLAEFKGLDKNDQGYRHYTSNEPRTYADKMISWLVGAELLIRIPQELAPGIDRKLNDMKERFAIGVLKAADERLLSLFLPALRDQLAFHVCVRGMAFARVVLYKRPDSGTTYVDVTPFDPLHSYWGVGPNGFEWCCYKMRKTRNEILAEYGVDIIGIEAPYRSTGPAPYYDTGPAPYYDTEDQLDVEVYDYYDGIVNTLVTPDYVLKPPTPHGSPRTPIAGVVVGAAPPIQKYDVAMASEVWEEYGESVFAANRKVYETNNDMFSTFTELIARIRKPGIKFKSRGAQKTLEDDPFKTGAEIALDVDEDIEPLQLLETTRDMMNFLTIVNGELQRGGLPHSVFGELQFQLSGFAINTLKQGIVSQIQPRIKALERMYHQQIDLVSDQYATGFFMPMSVSGMSRDRKHFTEMIPPQVVAQAGPYTLELKPNLPEDDQTKYAMAQLAREGPWPLLSDRQILDRVMGIQDVENLTDEIRVQMAERMTPLATLYAQMMAAVNQGNMELAQILMGQIQLLVMQQMMATMVPPQVPTPGGPQPGTPAGSPRLDPRVAPNAVLGAGPPPIQPQAGPNVPAGSPRPGAQSPATQRLNGMGLYGPNQ